jgi:hypothetical protein
MRTKKQDIVRSLTKYYQTNKEKSKIAEIPNVQNTDF